MYVARLNANPIHGGKMAHRITGMRVHHQLWLGRGAGGEIELQRIGGAGLTFGLECRRGAIALFVLMPALHLAADGRGPRTALVLRGLGWDGNSRTCSTCLF